MVDPDAVQGLWTLWAVQHALGTQYSCLSICNVKAYDHWTWPVGAESSDTVAVPDQRWSAGEHPQHNPQLRN